MAVDLRLYALVDPAVAGGRTLPELALCIADSATILQLRDKRGSTRAMLHAMAAAVQSQPANVRDAILAEMRAKLGTW